MEHLRHQSFALPTRPAKSPFSQRLERNRASPAMVRAAPRIALGDDLSASRTRPCRPLERADLAREMWPATGSTAPSPGHHAPPWPSTPSPAAPERRRCPSPGDRPQGDFFVAFPPQLDPSERGRRSPASARRSRLPRAHLADLEPSLLYGLPCQPRRSNQPLTVGEQLEGDVVARRRRGPPR